MVTDEQLIHIDPETRAELAEAKYESVRYELSCARHKLERRRNRSIAEVATLSSFAIGILSAIAIAGPLTLPIVTATLGLLGAMYGFWKLGKIQ